ncbi:MULTISPECIES: pepsin-like aspartic protease [Marinomonas]|uniref:A1 family peptidase n=1 Tax=Marinomonas arctica TaxID=383750 RepID=A0A7H1J2J7_9GAMM|nr:MULTISPECIES: pepsin-like aspartic protease [Marinomonas]MCS7486431.1 peptidase A24 [Marinomonas sp. BSi20414]QNT04713.1 A1 family peptidase [Marinomonas arctica]GGN30384.1 peptidase A1 [Marinomonas arctica]
MKKSVLVNDNATGLSISLDRGPFQNNGASPWYAYVGVGTPAQALKFAFDTGSNFMWVTSSLCKADTCHHYGDQQFVYQLSSSFSWVDQQTIAVDFGPWGSMAVKTGKDILTLTPDALGQIDSGPISLISDLYLAQAYEGVQFYELDWDGGIGIPSTTEVSDAPFAAFSYRGIVTQQTSEPTSFHFFQSLVEQGVVSAKCPYVAFLTDMDEGHGQVEFGQLNQDYRNSREYVFLPWDKYSVPYLWTSKINSLALGETQIIAPESTTNPPYFLALDSGSSQFKGDFDVMTRLYNLASHTKDNLIIEIGQTDLGEVGKLVVTSEMYDVLIEAGQQKGKVVTQFQPMEGADYIALVGSVLMDYLYTVYEFNVVEAAGNVSLLPVGMWVFNKSTGPKVITTTQSKPARIFHY